MGSKQATKTKIIWGCTECGCTDVQELAWVCVNTNEIVSREEPPEQIWCPNCESGGFGMSEVTSLLSLEELEAAPERKGENQ